MLFYLVADQVSTSRGDANIGLGLLAFELLLVGAGIWGVLDGSRRPYPQVAITWVSVAALMGLLVPTFTAMTESGFSARVLLSEMLGTVPFMVVLVAVPALLGAAVGLAMGSRRHDDRPTPFRPGLPPDPRLFGERPTITVGTLAVVNGQRSAHCGHPMRECGFDITSSTQTFVTRSCG